MKRGQRTKHRQKMGDVKIQITCKHIFALILLNCALDTKCFTWRERPYSIEQSQPEALFYKEHLV